MLYISRYVKRTEYGVTDTDDGVETIVTTAELDDIYRDGLLQIKGCNCKEVSVDGKPVVTLDKVKVYQLSQCLTRQQVKLKTMYGVDMTVNHGEIVGITWENNLLPSPLSIRLSDFGSRCGENIMRGAPLLLGYGNLKLVLDDKIDIVQNTFQGLGLGGLSVDVREVSSVSTVRELYEEVMRYPNSPDALSSYIIDLEDRQDYFKGVCILESGLEVGKRADSVLRDPVGVAEKLAKSYKRQFDTLSRMEFEYNGNDRWAANAKYAYNWLKQQVNLEWVNSGNHSRLWDSDIAKILEGIKEITTCNKATVIRLQNFVRYFDVPDDIVEIYWRFVQRASSWILENGGKHFWG